MADSRASFTRGIFAGAIHDELLFPFPDEHEGITAEERDRVRQLLAGFAGLAVDPAAIDERETIPEPIIRDLARIGILGLTIPREYGGLGLSATAYARVFGELSRADASVAVLVGVHCGLGSKAIVLYGNPEQKGRYLPALARGETLAAYALTEPNVGSDAQHIETSAVWDAARSEWVLNGRKIWIGNAHRAGVIVTFAQTPVERGGSTVQRPTAFIIRPDMPGFHVAGTVRKLGIRGSTQAELVYQDLRVPGDHVLGQVGKGFSVAVHVLNGGRLTLVAGCAAGARRVLGEMARYASERRQFGKPLAEFEITQRKLATLAAEVYAAGALLGELTALVDRGESDYSMEAACAKVFASDLIWRATDEMVQVAGGRGFVKPYPYERWLRDARINRIFEGTNEVLRLFIALNGVQGPAERLKELGSAIRRPLQNWGLLSGYAASRVRSVLGATPTLDAPLSERLATHKRYFEKHVAELKDHAERAIMKHRAAIVDRQFVLERLANMAVELVATACVLARTQHEIEQRGEGACEHQIALCDLFCVESGRRFRANRLALDEREEEVDATRRQVAEHLVRSDARRLATPEPKHF
ncbi:MAG TPA: acyl-CoA dehydrogenase family protein [Gemmatimonadaceae bacterium]|nr:acyl-CoA dehydrogenase family protein [Gemmatimonadaceae bacterium]